jgi:hypothetical protein
MKNDIVMCALLLPVLVYGSDHHTFTDHQGRTVEANIVKYDSATGKVQLETGSSKKTWVNPQVFSVADQEFIRSWISAEPFRSTSVFRILVRKEEADWKTAGKVGFSGGSRKSKTTRYTLKLHNTSQTDFQDLRMEYCIYRNKKKYGSSYIESKNYSKTIADIMAREEKEIDAVKSRSTRANQSEVVDEVIGVCFRIYMPVAGGEEVMREIRYPSSLSAKKFPWKEKKALSMAERYKVK